MREKEIHTYKGWLVSEYMYVCRRSGAVQWLSILVEVNQSLLGVLFTPKYKSNDFSSILAGTTKIVCALSNKGNANVWSR